MSYTQLDDGCGQSTNSICEQSSLDGMVFHLILLVSHHMLFIQFRCLSPSKMEKIPFAVASVGEKQNKNVEKKNVDNG